MSIKDKAGQVNELYSSGLEDMRLTSGKSAMVEFITTIRVLGDYLTREPMRILDLGAGTGAYIVPLTEMRGRDFFNPATEITYDHDTFHVTDFPFVFFTLGAARDMLKSGGVEILREIASDGVSELLGDVIDAMSEISYQEYLKYHFYCCEKPEILGRSNHLLFVWRKMQYRPLS